MHEILFMAAGHMAALRTAPQRAGNHTASTRMCEDADLRTRGAAVVVPLAICLLYAVLRSSYVLWVQGATVRTLQRELARVGSLLVSVALVQLVPWRGLFALRYVSVSYFALQFLTDAPWGSPLAWAYIAYSARNGPGLRLVLLEWLVSGTPVPRSPPACGEAVHIAAGAACSLLRPTIQWAWRALS